MFNFKKKSKAFSIQEFKEKLDKVADKKHNETHILLQYSSIMFDITYFMGEGWIRGKSFEEIKDKILQKQITYPDDTILIK